MENPVAEAAHRLFSSTWFVMLGGVTVTVYVAALLWKILRSEEGFLFGYGDWIIGKWQKERGNGAPYQRGGGDRRRQRETASLDRQVQAKANVLKLSRLLDGDLAYLMVNDVDDWEPKIIRALQTTVSGVTRVVRPAGRCRCGFFILDEDEQHLVMATGEGYSGDVVPRLALDHSCAGRAFMTGDNYYCRDIATDPVYWHSEHGRRNYRSIACTPVRAGNVVFGVVCIDAEEVGAFTPDDFTHLEVFAAKLAVFCALHTLQATGVCAVRPKGG